MNDENVWEYFLAHLFAMSQSMQRDFADGYLKNNEVSWQHFKCVAL